MKRFFSVFLALCMLVAAGVGSAEAAFKQMWAKVYKMESTTIGDPVLTEITTNVETLVLMRNTNHEETIYVYNDPALTALTNPIDQGAFESATKMHKGAGTIAFQVDPSESNDTYVDLVVTHLDGGFTAFVEDFTDETHKIVIDERPNIMHHGCIQWTDNTASGAVSDTQVDFLPDSIIHTIVLQTITGASACTADVGLLSTETSGDHDGFIAGCYVNAAQFFNPKKPTITAGATETYVAAVASIGALMGKGLAGANTSTDEGSQYNWEHIIYGSNAKSLVYSTASGGDTATGLLHYFFTRMK